MRRTLNHERARTRIVERTIQTVRLARTTHGPAMQNQPVGKIRPLLRRKTSGDLTLYGNRIGGGIRPIGTPAQSPGNANHMRINRKPGHPERIAKHHIRGLAANPGQRNQRFHISGNLTAESRAQLMRKPNDIPRLGAMKTNGADNALHTLGIGPRKLCRTRVTRKQLRSDRIHTSIRGLRAQHRSHQKLKRIGKIQRALRMRYLRTQNGILPPHALQPRLLGFPRHATGSPRHQSAT